MPDQPPPRRRFQFRLRTLMLAVTIAAVICAVCLPMIREWLKPPSPVEPWLQVDVFTGSADPMASEW